MQAAIEQALSVLIGLPMWAARRTVTLHSFQFGGVHEVIDRHGEVATVGEYALHIQSAWHLAGPTSVIVGSDDRYFAAGDEPFERGDDWDGNTLAANRCDERMTAFYAARATNPPVVTAIAGDNLGGIRITLDDDLTLAAFSTDSLGAEHWRLFQPWNKQHDHFVVTGASIEE